MERRGLSNRKSGKYGHEEDLEKIYLFHLNKEMYDYFCYIIKWT